MTNQLNKIIEFDQKFCEFIQKNKLNDPFLFLVPSNLDVEREKFFQHLEKKQKYTPHFEYNNNINKNFNFNKLSKKLHWYYLELEKLSFQNKHFFLRKIYVNKIKEINCFINLIDSIKKDKRFTHWSLKSYGKPSKINYLLARLILRTKQIQKIIEIRKKEKCSKKEIYELFREYTQKNKIKGWKLEIKKEIISNALTINKDKKIIINHKLRNKIEFKQILEHELGVHAKRYENGLEILKIFSIGLRRYDLLEEGLATLNELKTNGILEIAYDPAIKLCAVHISYSNNFYNSFIKLNKIVKNDDLAFRYLMRAKRGTSGGNGTYTKDYIYFTGFISLLLLFLKNIYKQNILNEDLLIGKISFSEIKLIPKIKQIKKEINQQQ